jgi:hypothetical protein
VFSMNFSNDITSLLSRVASESTKGLQASTCFAAMTPSASTFYSPATSLMQHNPFISSSSSSASFDRDQFIRHKRAFDTFARQPVLQRPITDTGASITNKRMRRSTDATISSSTPTLAASSLPPVERRLLKAKQQFEATEFDCKECKAVNCIVVDWKEGVSSCTQCGLVNEKKLVIDSVELGARDRDYEEDVDAERKQASRTEKYNKSSDLRRKTCEQTERQLALVQSSSLSRSTVRAVSKTTRQLMNIDSREATPRDHHITRFFKYITDTWAFTGLEHEPSLCHEAATLLADLAIKVNRTFPYCHSSCVMYAACLFVVAQNQPRYKRLLALPTLVDDFVDIHQIKPAKNESGETIVGMSLAEKKERSSRALAERVQHFLETWEAPPSASSSSSSSSSSTSPSSPTATKPPASKVCVEASRKVRFTKLSTEINYIYQVFGTSLPSQYRPPSGQRPQLFWEYVTSLLTRYSVDARFPVNNPHELKALMSKLQEVQNNDALRAACEQKQPDSIAATIYLKALAGWSKSVGSKVVKLGSLIAEDITGVSKATMSSVKSQLWPDSTKKESVGKKRKSQKESVGTKREAN